MKLAIVNSTYKNSILTGCSAKSSRTILLTDRSEPRFKSHKEDKKKNNFKKKI